MKKLLSAAFALVIACTTFCRAQNTVTHSSIVFKTKNMGIGVDGTIGGLQATIHFNAGDATTASIDASVEVGTLNSDNSLRDDHLKGDEFFDVAHYPKILIKSVAITHKGGNKYVGQFNLTIKNKTKSIQFPFTYTSNAGVSIFNGSFKINRLEYGIGTSSLTLADEVAVSIEAEIRD